MRDTYFVATEGPEATEIYDVFMLDEDFSIERPKRVYRTGFNLLSGHKAVHAIKGKRDRLKADDHSRLDFDPSDPLSENIMENSGEPGRTEDRDDDNDAEHDASQHTFFIANSQRKIKLVARNARQMHQFIVSMERVAASCVWASRNRFDSFAPLRVNCAAQWLVDGRDYFWTLSRAVNMAKETIYIHDWW